MPSAERGFGGFPPLQQQNPSESSAETTNSVDDIRQSLLSMPSFGSTFATTCVGGSPFTRFDQSMPSLTESSYHQQVSFPAAASSLQLAGAFPPASVLPPLSFDPNFNSLTTSGPLNQTTATAENFWTTSSCLPFGNANLYAYPGPGLVTGISESVAAASDGTQNVDDARQDSSLWRPY